MRSQIFKILLVWAGFHFFAVSGKVVPFLEPVCLRLASLVRTFEEAHAYDSDSQGFFFDYNVPGQPVPIPITGKSSLWARTECVLMKFV